MLSISLPEIVIILVFALIILGPNDTVKAAFFIGKTFSKAKNAVIAMTKKHGLNELVTLKDNLNKNVINDNFASMQQSLDSLSVDLKNSIKPTKKECTTKSEVSKDNEQTKTTHLETESINELLVRIQKLDDELASIRQRVLALQHASGQGI